MNGSVQANCGRRGARRFRQSGAAAVEFAVVFPLFIAALVTFADLIFMMRDYAVITIAAREGARFGTILPHGTLARPTADQVALRATDYVNANMVNLGTTGSVPPAATVYTGPAGALAPISGSTSACAQTGHLVRVDVTFTTGQTSILYSVYKVILTNMAFSASATLRCE